MRLNKFLAHKDFCSRREADRLIAQGLVWVNASQAQLGTVLQDGDEIEFEGLNIFYQADEVIKPVYIFLNKPVGIESTCEKSNPRNIIRYLDSILDLDTPRVYPVGRLDLNSRGLIILTNDGDFAYRYSHPRFMHEKEYIVQLDRNFTDDFVVQISAGVEIPVDSEKIVTAPCACVRENPNTFRITLHQGYKRQIRLMSRALGYEVRDLYRVRIDKWSLEKDLMNLKEGQAKMIDV